MALGAHIAQAIARGRLTVLEECRHFAYLEAPVAFCEHLGVLFESS
jgi:pimeloyl-ACP methyl ester carboxylesterase